MLSISVVTAQPIIIDYHSQTHPISPFWAGFGYDEANYTYMQYGRRLLGEIAALSPVPVYIRCHNLLTTGDGIPDLKWSSTNAYTEDKEGHPIYDWRIVDSIFDTYVALHLRPFAEIGFMPEALSTHPEPYRHHWHPGVRYDSIYTGWAWPPVDYGKWARLVEAWVRHCVQRYGADEVAKWRWEVWNEPNIAYWKGTEAEYFRLYDSSAAAVKRALPTAAVGGPAITGPGGANAARWLRDFLDHCAKAGTPLDFISYHAKGNPKVVFDDSTTGTPPQGHVRMNRSPELQDISQGFSIVRSSPFAQLPVYISECDPEGCAACGMATNPENAYRNGTMYSSYTAASFARIAALADSCHVDLARAISWSFEFEGQGWFRGFRDLATNGVDKPVLNVFRLFGKMQGSDIPADSAYASADEHSVSVMTWNYEDDDVAGPPAEKDIVFHHLPARRATVTEYRIDSAHSNAYEVWKTMGSPQRPTAQQYHALEVAGQLETMSGPRTYEVTNGELEIRLLLPRQAVSLVRLDF